MYAHSHTSTIPPHIEKHSHPSLPLIISSRYIYGTLLSLLIVIVLLFLRSVFHTQRPPRHPTQHSSRTVTCLTTNDGGPDQTISSYSPHTGTADRYHETRCSDHHRCDHAHTTHSHTCACTCMYTPLAKRVKIDLFDTCISCSYSLRTCTCATLALKLCLSGYSMWGGMVGVCECAYMCVHVHSHL